MKQLQMFGMVDYVREMAAKKSGMSGKYGLFEYLLFSIIHTEIANLKDFLAGNIWHKVFLSSIFPLTN